ncbi:Uncharacterized protein BP5553_02336 [Venustampulla echinocandica]|uniref:Uncharacterized protein n=1 Tax=Venustampulla echinocandica TaxID=2656787 RepID=A0A370U3I9_9HELO|nr:Uncharacterized protein BP5553_02336 [Venustampulla echinocandica]RDL42357.1 Uncharacterized protein BP5553_02336 [Venustampulla echinocandica]
MSSRNRNGPGQMKPRKKAVKPILKKITHSEKNSLDLDRLAVEQDGFGGSGVGMSEYGMPSRSSHDAVFNATGRRGYHNRSTSGTSQFSTATAGSGHRGVAFVHPFQQTPRPYTPPLAPPSSKQNSLRESEYSERESPAFETSTEDEDQARRPHLLRNLSSTNQTSSSLNSTASPVLPQEPLRIQTKPSPSRLALATSSTSLHIHNPAGSLTVNPEVGSPSETMSPSSLRTSIEGFRLRSRSEAGDSRYRPETIQEARRKFYEREQAKEEKAAREEIRLREKQDQKRAREIERKYRRSSAASEATRSKRSKSDLTRKEKREGSFASHHNFGPGQGDPFSSQARDDGVPGKNFTKLAKKKTHSAWTKLMMWLRTRIIRMGGKRDYDN